MSFWVYILRCADGSYYTGHTDDLERRFAQHQAGAFAGYTRDRRPVELMFSDTFQTREEALARELQIKDWSRKKKEALFRADWAEVAIAARSRPRVSTLLDARSNRTDPDAAHEEVNGASPPAIVLVRPQLGENIGKAARAMLNFGLTDLRLVAPRDGWPNPSAGPAASGADSVLEQARIFPDVAAAVADCAHVFATTVRRRGVTKPVLTPEEAARAVRSAQGGSAILFGAERSGLATENVALARTIVTVPINPDFGSLNLAQAVILLAYEWSKHVSGGARGEALVQPPVTEIEPPAPQADLEGLIEHLDTMLEAAGYFFPPDRAPVTRRMLRTLLTKPGWSAPEVRTVRGVLSTIDRPRRR